ncbi:MULTISPECIES: helix-turn-helix domain-containing protein [Glycomyces]|uniref:Helix-turn-helix transcriptional regulator n=2 Tax=Glycomyces TaxID=58113 RepID=A0A9X3PQK3_9ACTN|nr:helix-turn-helix transcriptional regulator [Glycomyces lechevalierae]MDA1387427.1 helix-turn-helix transcriptional regulator [Glycomyces lechevalierae]MDR7338602.1 transcriptional regulator with XRE-family HTH domain [Glycomyces lechevalierae]
MAKASAEDLPSGTTTLRVMIGGKLRQLRTDADISREEAAYEIRADASKISRIELGRVSFRLRDVRDLMIMYGVQDEDEIERVVDMAREANRPSKWKRYNDFLPNWFSNYLEMEGAAAMIRTYEVQVFPGLLQNEEYARAVMMLGYGHTPLTEIDKRIEVRMKRQEILDRTEKRPELWAVIDEAALHRPFGGKGVMRGQIQTLIDFCDKPNVRVQVVPFSAGAHSGAGAPFTWLRFAYEELSDVIYLEHLTGGLYLERDSEIDAYQAAMEHLCIQATQPHKTQDFLREILRDRYS